MPIGRLARFVDDHARDRGVPEQVDPETADLLAVGEDEGLRGAARPPAAVRPLEISGLDHRDDEAALGQPAEDEAPVRAGHDSGRKSRKGRRLPEWKRLRARTRGAAGTLMSTSAPPIGLPVPASIT